MISKHKIKTDHQCAVCFYFCRSLQFIVFANTRALLHPALDNHKIVDKKHKKEY